VNPHAGGVGLNNTFTFTLAGKGEIVIDAPFVEATSFF